MSQEAIEWLESQPMGRQPGSVVPQPLIGIKDDVGHAGAVCACYEHPAYPLSIPWTEEAERAWLDNDMDLFLELTRPESLYDRHRGWYQGAGHCNVVLTEDGYQYRMAPDGITLIREEVSWPSSTKTT